MWFKRNIWKIIGALAVTLVLAAAFFLQDAPVPDGAGGIDDDRDETVQGGDAQREESKGEKVPDDVPQTPEEPQKPDDTPSEGTDDTPEDGESTDEPPETTTEPDDGASHGAEPSEDAGSSDAQELTCTVSISCSTLLDNMDILDPEKAELVPEDGIILSDTAVKFEDGETAFDVLQRICRDESVHLEFSITPLYSSAYIEGIGNIYEFDAGALSGWLYSVNGYFPNYSSSKYILSEGDTVAFVFTCDLGYDVGAGGVTQE